MKCTDMLEMKNFRKQAKKVKDLKWQIIKAINWRELDGYNKKLHNRVKYYSKQYEVALKRLKTM
jgi:hypothetical protein